MSSTKLVTPARPQLSDEIIMEALKKHMPAKEGEWNFQDIVEQYTGAQDSFELMRDLERNCLWDGSAQLLDDLDVALMYVNRHLDLRLREWVSAEGVKPSKSQGDDVTYNGLRGKVVGFDLKRGYYLLQFHEPYSKAFPALIGDSVNICAPFEEL